MYIVTWIDKEHVQIFQVGSKIKQNKTGSRCNYWMSLGASQHLGLQRFAIGVNCWIPVVGCCFLVPHGWIVVFLRSSLLVRVAAVAPITLKVPAKIAKNTKNIKHEVKCTSFPMVQRTQHMYFQCVLDVNQSPQNTPHLQITYKNDEKSWNFLIENIIPGSASRSSFCSRWSCPTRASSWTDGTS